MNVMSNNLQEALFIEELQQLAGTTSHELRDPLREALHLLEHLTKDQPFEPRLYGITAQIELVLARLESLKAYLYLTQNNEPAEHLSLNEILSSVMKNLTDDITRTGAEITVSPLPHYEGRPGQLTLLFTELLKNSIHYNDSLPPQIRIHAISTTDAITLCIEDNGIGLAPEYVNFVFGLFNRGEETLDRTGHGMGLCLARKIAENHGGSLVLESHHGEWTKALLTLPLKAN